MKRDPVEKVMWVFCLIGIILLARFFVNKQRDYDAMKKAHLDSLAFKVDSLERVAMKVDSLENIISMYNIQDSYWDVEINADGEEFTDYFETNFANKNPEKVVILASPGNGDCLHWHIKVKTR